MMSNHRVRLRSIFMVIAAFCFCFVSYRALAQQNEIRIAAAADLQFAMANLAEQFEKETGSKLDVTYGSSGNFFSQIQNGAPFDLFFSADIEYPRRLEAAGLSEPGSLFPYAMGQIVMWAPSDSKLDLAREQWDALFDPRVQKIAIANPEHAPYGRAAVAAMRKAGVYEKVQGKLVFGEDISQAAQFVHSGNAQVGIVARSLAMSPGMEGGKTWQIPADDYPSIQQGAVLLKNAKNKGGARAFLEFVKSESGLTTLVKYGFGVPGHSAH